MEELLPSWRLAVFTILGEAESEPYEGKLAVAMVIRNRMRLKYSSDGTLADTVLRPLQFSCWNTDNRRRDDICRRSLEDPAVMNALQAWQESAHSHLVGPDVVLYHTQAPPKGAGTWPPDWANRARFERQIGEHIFYADPKVS